MIFSQIERLCCSTEKEIVIVAPFMKAPIVNRVLRAVPDTVAVTAITRWWPEEIVQGVSDLDVWLCFRDRPLGRLFLRHDLHAKYYRGDHTCLVGSANLTARALGLTMSPNLELLVELPSSVVAIQNFEANVFENVVEVTDDLYRCTAQAVQMLSTQISKVEDERPGGDATFDIGVWLPASRQPEDLYEMYCGNAEVVPSSSRLPALRDLHVLQIPPGLNPSAFEMVVGTRLLTMPVVAAVDRFVSVKERRFGEVRDHIYAHAPTLDSSHAWQTLFRWLMYFLPRRYTYRRPAHSELIGRASNVDVATPV
ncbi:MAG TPA: phospholipase D family protein [Candidatus Limnocylindrales bacterium]|nr:phospholipase D family protein [Candidatus Limnocylindrales bacterium]